MWQHFDFMIHENDHNDAIIKMCVPFFLSNIMTFVCINDLLSSFFSSSYSAEAEPIFKFVGFVFFKQNLFRKIQHTFFLSFAQGDKAFYHFCDGNICGNVLKVPVFRCKSQSLYFPFSFLSIDFSCCIKIYCHKLKNVYNEILSK